MKANYRFSLCIRRVEGKKACFVILQAQAIISCLFPKENANEEQRREFMDEINLMKAVGKHQNVLSFLGCWTTTKPLLLIIEYVPHGDLLHWLRHKRSQVFVTYGLNTSYSTA